MDNSYVKSVVQGLLVSGAILSVGGAVGVTLFATIAFTQFYWLVVWVPVVFLTIFLWVTMVLLQKDATAQKSSDS